MFITFWLGSLLLLIHHIASEQMTYYPESFWIKVRLLAGVAAGVLLIATLVLLVF